MGFIYVDIKCMTIAQMIGEGILKFTVTYLMLNIILFGGIV